MGVGIPRRPDRPFRPVLTTACPHLQGEATEHPIKISFASLSRRTRGCHLQRVADCRAPLAICPAPSHHELGIKNVFDDLPPHLGRLPTLRVWHALSLQRIDHKIAALQRAGRTGTRPAQPAAAAGVDRRTRHRRRTTAHRSPCRRLPHGRPPAPPRQPRGSPPPARRGHAGLNPLPARPPAAHPRLSPGLGSNSRAKGRAILRSR